MFEYPRRAVRAGSGRTTDGAGAAGRARATATRRDIQLERDAHHTTFREIVACRKFGCEAAEGFLGLRYTRREVVRPMYEIRTREVTAG
ncbi:hypothetical protein GCM10023324_15420 [Streptomyces youssoufiensis]